MEHLTASERKTSNALRRHLLTTPGLEADLVRAAVAELYPRRAPERDDETELSEDVEYQDKERELWQRGDVDREN